MKKTVFLIAAAIIAAVSIFTFSPMTASADDEEVVSVSTDTLFGKNKTVTIYGRASRAWNLRGDSYVDFSIYKAGKEVAHQRIVYDYDKYNYRGWVSFEYKAAAYGRYTVKYSTWDAPSSKHTVTFTVKKPSTITSYKPVVSLEGYEENTVRLYGLMEGCTTTVYRSSSKTGKYRRIGTTTGDEFLDNNAPCGSDYYYKIMITIKSGKKSYHSKKSAPAVCYRSKPPKPVIKSIARVKNGESSAKVTLKFKWKKNSKYLKDTTKFEIQVSRSKEFGIDPKTGYYNYDVLEQNIPGDVYSYTTDYLDYITYLEEPGVYYFRLSAKRSLYGNHITTAESKVHEFTIE